MRKTLLLTFSYEVLRFISDRKAFKLFFMDKAEVISNWGQDYYSCNGNVIKQPSILRLKKHFRISYININFSRKSVIKRDNSQCQYCNKRLVGSQITIDHIIPKVQGGITSFANCVVCCKDCNSKKADKTLDQVNVVLLNKPTHPSFSTQYHISDKYQDNTLESWNEDWDDYIVR